jgi:hypothetical protein
MTYGDMIFRGIIGGWVDVYRVATTLADGSMCVVNTHFEPMGFWEGLGCGWVEEHVLRVERDIAASLEDTFGSNEPSAHADSDSIIFKSGGNNVASITGNGTWGLGTITPSTSLNVDNITGTKFGPGKWLDYTETRIAVTSNKPKGKWTWEHIIIESDHFPNPIRKTLISLLTGAKWIPYSSKHETKHYGYLRLMPNPAHLIQKMPSIG